MKSKIIKIFTFACLLFIGLNTAYADITFKVDGAQDVKVGDTFQVNVSVSGADEADTLTDYNLTVSYDTSVLELVGGTANISAGNQQIKGETVLSTLNFRANAAKDTNLKLEGNGILINGEAPEKGFNINYNSGNVKIRNLVSDSTLKSLKIPNTVLTPSFDKNIHDYKATVTDVTSIDIKAEPNDAHTTCAINQEVAGNLQKGENTVIVVCTSETGAKSEYDIKVTLNVTPTEAELLAADATLKSLSIKGQKIDFSPTEKKYYINVDYETTKINVNATPTNPNAEVNITGNLKFVVGKNTVKIAVTSEDKTKTETYQIIVTRENEETDIVKTCPDSTSNKEWVVFTVSLLVTFTLGIVLGYFLCKKDVLNKIFKRKKNEETPVEIETLSDTIDLSDTIKKTSKPKETTKK